MKGLKKWLRSREVVTTPRSVSASAETLRLNAKLAELGRYEIPGVKRG